MVLKVQIDGGKKTLTGPGRVPVTFIDGEKRILIKGVTFINGEKKVLWDSHRLGIDYISNLFPLLGYVPTGVCAGKDKVLVTGNNALISRLDISNISNPILETSVANGFVTSYSQIDSVGTDNLTFYGRVKTTGVKEPTYNELVVNPSTMTVEVKSTYIFTYSYTLSSVPAPVKMGSSWWSLSTDTTAQMFVDSNQKYYFSQYTSNALNKINSNLIKIDDEKCIGIYWSNTIKGIGTYTPTEVSPLVTNKNYINLLVCQNGNLLTAGPSGIGLYNSNGDALSLLSAKTGYNYSVIGQIGKFYYVIEEPAPSKSPKSGVTLYILDLTGTVYDTLPLTLTVTTSPNTNINPYGTHILTVPHISKSGYLTFYWVSDSVSYPGNNDKLVRIEGY